MTEQGCPSSLKLYSATCSQAGSSTGQQNRLKKAMRFKKLPWALLLAYSVFISTGITDGHFPFWKGISATDHICVQPLWQPCRLPSGKHPPPPSRAQEERWLRQLPSGCRYLPAPHASAARTSPSPSDGLVELLPGASAGTRKSR